MQRLVASVEGGLCFTLEHFAVSHFRFILSEINLLFFEMNTTDVGYFITISNRVSKCVVSSNAASLKSQDKSRQLMWDGYKMFMCLGSMIFSLLVLFALVF